ncbi:proteasome assembly chaperone 2 isoform X3 [Anastrepha obliqua]|uniref:proteasome assembly chaperone 2 isoform X3 n=1 Tax=Anastrepha obliqua TaxID=95512 RepID=UPI00240A0531|nr:proteasome assembly chaperone 2 isoform X3 [Anastrepha obliqua]
MLQLKNRSTLDLKEYTVIIPSICVGNAAQLACDLLIASKKMQRVASLMHPALIPVFGPSAYQHEPEERVAACEIYECVSNKLVVIQFRTPLISRHAQSLHNYLADLVQQARRVVILSASFGFEKREIGTSPYEYCVSERFRGSHKTQLANVKWMEFKGEMIFGGGNGLQLFRLLKEKEVPVMLLFRYVLEGDNSTDATLIVRELNDLCSSFLQLEAEDKTIKLTVPVSWKLLFGNDVTAFIF